MSMRFRITVRGLAIELRGYFDDLGDADQPSIQQLAEAMKPFGMVVASPMARTGDPWDGQPTPEKSYAMIFEKLRDHLSEDSDPTGFVHEMAQIHYGQALVIRGERERADAAEAELQSRELHHFETEQIIDKIKALCDQTDTETTEATQAWLVNNIRAVVP